jgi:hypothetical protein
MSLVSNKPVLSGSLKSVRLVSLKFSKKLIIAALVYLASQSVAVNWAAAQSVNSQNAVSARWQNLLQSAKGDQNKQAYKSAEEKLLRAMALVKSNDLNRYIETLNALGDLAFVADWGTKCLTYRKQVFDLCSNKKDQVDELPLYQYKLGLAYYYTKKYSQSVALLKPSVLQMANYFGQDNPYLAELYDDLARALQKSGDSQLANTYRKKAETINNAYFKKLQSSIKKAWHPPKRSKSISAVVLFVNELDGRLDEAKLKVSSGDKEFDQICLTAIANTSVPLETWHEFVPSRKINTEFSFDYKDHNIGSIESKSGFSNSEALLRTSLTKKSAETEKQKQEFAALKSKTEQLNDNDMISILGLTESLRNSNNAKENELIIDSLRQTPGYSEKDSKVRLFVDALPGLDYARMSKLTEAETTLKPIVENPHFGDLPSKIKEKMLKCYGDVLYKQNKIEQAEAVYTQIKTLQRK